MDLQLPSHKSQYKPPQAVIVGVVLGAWGHTGEVRVKSSTDNPLRFSQGGHILAEGQLLQIQESRWHRDIALIKFHGVDTQEAAEYLRGARLEVPLDKVPPLNPDSYYHFQILDMEVWTQADEFLGRVEDILATGSNDVYVVRHAGKEVLIPALEHVIIDIALDEGVMTVALPDGLR